MRSCPLSHDGSIFMWKFILKPELDQQKQDELDDHGSKPSSRHTHIIHRKLIQRASMNIDINTLPYLARGRYQLEAKHYFHKHAAAKVHSCSMHKGKHASLLVVGFENGVFGLYEMPDFNQI